MLVRARRDAPLVRYVTGVYYLGRRGIIGIALSLYAANEIHNIALMKIEGQRLSKHALPQIHLNYEDVNYTATASVTLEPRCHQQELL